MVLNIDCGHFCNFFFSVDKNSFYCIDSYLLFYIYCIENNSKFNRYTSCGGDQIIGVLNIVIVYLLITYTVTPALLELIYTRLRYSRNHFVHNC